MASSKKASKSKKAAKSAKAATSKKAAGSKKAASKASATSRVFGFFTADGEVTHSPIIITDGSASIQFDSREYPDTGTDTHRSTGLLLREVLANKLHPVLNPPDSLRDGDPPGTAVCHSFTDGAQYEVRVTCAVGGNEMNYIIRGSFLGASRSPTITFNHVTPPREYREGGNFPASRPGSRRFGNANRRITRLQIFRDGTPIHDCPLVGAGIEYTIVDAHA